MKMNSVNGECFEDILMKIEPKKVRPMMPEYWKEVRLNASNDFCPYCGANLREDNNVSESV